MSSNLKKHIKKAQRDEAIKRMKMIGFSNELIKRFKDGIVCKSETSYGIIRSLTQDELLLVKEFEKKHDGVAFHIIRNMTKWGELVSILYVSRDRDEWEYDKEDIKHNTAVCFVYNLADRSCSEFGSIGYSKINDGLIRTF